jgi:hypothetical protein
MRNDHYSGTPAMRSASDQIFPVSNALLGERSR